MNRMMYGRGSTPGSFPKKPATPVPISTIASHASMRGVGPCANRPKVIGPGAMKKTKIQIGQCASR